jgi:hypothetical protein
MPWRLFQVPSGLGPWHTATYAQEAEWLVKQTKVRYVRDLQPFTGAMTLAYRKGSINEADHLSRRTTFYAQTSLLLFGDGDVRHSVNSR